MNTNQLIEKVAETIYCAEGGLTDEDYEEILGESRRAWSALEGWERDGYRAQAKAAIKVLSSSPAFEEAWAKKKLEGYQYGRDALEQVRFGWNLRVASLKEALK